MTSRTGWVIVLLTLLAVKGWAGGIFVSLGSSAQPTMPYERAVVSYRKGVETMVVESNLVAPPGDYAWILPVPSKPIQEPQQVPGSVDRVQYSLRTLPLYMGPDMLSFFAWGLTCAAGGIALALGERSGKRRGTVLLICLAVSLLIGIAWPVYAESKPAAWRQLPFSQRTFLETSDAVVLQGADETAVVKWLQSQHGELSPASTQVVRDLARKGWCFVVAKVTAVGSSLSAPVAMAITYRTDAPTYPMQLSGTMASSLVLDLAVIGDGTASVPPLRIWKSQLAPTILAVPAADDIVRSWSFGTWTRLRGEVYSSQMKDDFEIQIGAPTVIHKMWSRIEKEDAHDKGVAAALGGLAVLLAGLVASGLSAKPRLGLAVALPLGLLVTCGWWYRAWISVEVVEPGIYLDRK